jgi:hypothetical protein
VRRAAAVLTALAAIVMTGCAGRDRYAPTLSAAEVIGRVQGVVSLAIGPDKTVYYALASGEVYALGDDRPALIATFPTAALDSIAISSDGILHGAYRDAGRLTVATWVDRAARGFLHLRANGPAQIAYNKNGDLLVAVGDRLADAQGHVISNGWHSPRIAAGRDNRIWVADDAPGTEKELVARGREKDGAKRRRFASALPPHTDPSGIALRKDELLVCGRRLGRVYRLHIGLDDVARRRGTLAGLKCTNAIVVAPDGAVITATDNAILRYGAR